MTKPTKDYVEGLMEYRKESGDFVWKLTQGSVKSGRLAGSLHTTGYVHIGINKKYYKVHQLVWLMETGKWPDAPLDHIDGNGSNNRYSNLRLCTMSQNKANSRSYKNNTSGIKGVWPRGKKWRAAIQCRGKRIHLGAFATKEEAFDAYMFAAKQLFGQFARAA